VLVGTPTCPLVGFVNPAAPDPPPPPVVAVVAVVAVVVVVVEPAALENWILLDAGPGALV
jgi:hypothetical protein